MTKMEELHMKMIFSLALALALPAFKEAFHGTLQQ
jgi:hypothetical protein